MKNKCTMDINLSEVLWECSGEMSSRHKNQYNFKHPFPCTVCVQHKWTKSFIGIKIETNDWQGTYMGRREVSSFNVHYNLQANQNHVKRDVFSFWSALVVSYRSSNYSTAMLRIAINRPAVSWWECICIWYANDSDSITSRIRGSDQSNDYERLSQSDMPWTSLRTLLFCNLRVNVEQLN